MKRRLVVRRHDWFIQLAHTLDMVRLLRFILPDQPQHVIQRGNNRKPVFYDKVDYLFYLEKLGATCEKHECDLRAYVQYLNYTYDRSGTLLEGRYKATLLDSE